LNLIDSMTQAEDFWSRLLRVDPATGYDPTESELIPDGRAPHCAWPPLWKLPWESAAMPDTPGRLSSVTGALPIRAGRAPAFKSIIVAALMALVLGRASIAKAHQEMAPDHYQSFGFELNVARAQEIGAGVKEHGPSLEAAGERASFESTARSETDHR
jgi:hypothetical protein